MTEQDSLRERLIDAGVELVLSEGSASVGLREIARRAGVSHGAPRRYFPTHHALLSAIARRGFEDLAVRFEAAAAGMTTPRGELAALARVYVGYGLDKRGMFELMFRHDLLDRAAQASHQPPLRESSLPLFRRLTALVARCQDQREAAPRTSGQGQSTPQVVAAALWSNLHGMAQLWAWGTLQLAFGPTLGSTTDDDQRDRLITAVLDAHLGPATS
ncbi:TetR/AcrR family transcriptional regulator [Streptomyces sp. NPDC002853]